MSGLAPPIKFRQEGTNGLALVGGKVYTYAAGTSTPKASYTDSTLGTANANPVILNSRGEADIWLDGSYKITVTDSLDVLLYTVDNIRDITNAGTFANPTITGTPVFTGTTVTWSGNPTHSGSHTWTGNQVFNGNVTIGDASSDTLTIAPNAVTWSNNPTHSGNHTWSGNQNFNGNVAVGNAGADTFTVASNAVTWSGNPTHSGNNTWSGNTVFDGTVDLAGSGQLTSGGAITRFESSEQACPTTTGDTSVAHGGPRKPDIVYVVLRCKITEANYAVGDEVQAITNQGGGQQAWASATTVGFINARAGTPQIFDKSTAGLGSVTSANWRLVFYCHWL